ncbi:MAG TPA: isoprenylcysteine carboxylmethyltransferase family protein [Williamwhitmania sp.]|nr:isoprenylcysteine carboxylmethyltransferase family protein [Williamwhitmania sp.]
MAIFITVWAAWFASEVLLNSLMRSGKKDKKGQDKGSISLIWITIALANTLGVMFYILNKFPISSTPVVQYIGLGLIVAGMAFRFYAIWSLGKLFTVNVTIRENHKIKMDGIYKTVRHPSYSGAILTFIGFGLSLNSWASLITIGVLVIAAFLYRIHIEERMLLSQFGEDYHTYMLKTYRLVPWIY